MSDFAAPLMAPDKVIVPVEPIELELANAMVPLKVAGVALLLYKELPDIPVELCLACLAIASGLTVHSSY